MAAKANVQVVITAKDQASTTLKGINGRIQGMSAQLRKAGIGMMAFGGAVVGGMALAMQSAAGLETAMREVNTMMGLSQDDFADFSKEVQTLASNLGVSAVDSAKALYQAISAGIPKENAIEFLKIATQAAIGGVTETTIAVDGLTTVLNAFKLPVSNAQKVADLMFTTVKGGKTTFEELSASLFQVAPIAAASGVSFEEVSAALATMTKQGVPTKVATTQLRQAMVALQKPTADMAKVINHLGYESGQTMLEELGLADTLIDLRDSTSGSNEMLMKMFGSVEAGAAVLALTGDNAAMFTTDLEAMANATGAATGAFEEMEKSVSRQMATLKSSFDDIKISIGNVLLPILKDLLNNVKPIIESIKNWAAEHPKLTGMIIKVVGAIGGLMLLLGPLLIMLPGITAALPILGVAFTALMGPIGLIIAAIAALIAVGVLVWKNWDTISAKAKAIWGNIVEWFKSVADKIGGFFTSMADAIKDAFFNAVNWVIDRLNSLIGLINKIPGVNIAPLKNAGVTPIKETTPAWHGMEGPPPGIGIPGFQYGGIMPYTGLAYLHRGETVIPTNESPQTIIIRNELDGELLSEIVLEKAGQKYYERARM